VQEERTETMDRYNFIQVASLKPKSENTFVVTTDTPSKLDVKKYVKYLKSENTFVVTTDTPSKLDVKKYVKYLKNKTYSRINIALMTVGLARGDRLVPYNCVQHGKRNVLYCLAACTDRVENFVITAFSAHTRFLSVVSDFGQVCALVPAGRDIVLTKLKRDGEFVPMAIASTKSDCAMVHSAKNGERDYTVPSVLRISVYEAIPRMPPSYGAASAPPCEPDLCTDGDEFETARLVTGAETGQSYTQCTMFEPGKELSSIAVVMLIKRLH